MSEPFAGFAIKPPGIVTDSRPGEDFSGSPYARNE